MNFAELGGCLFLAWGQWQDLGAVLGSFTGS
jgi:hypothetical protein